MSLFGNTIKILLILFLLGAFQLNAQEMCIELSVKIEDSIKLNENLRLIIITSNDTIIGRKDKDQFCFKNNIPLNDAVSIVIELQDKKLLFPSLFPGFLKLNDNPKWIVKIDRKPFEKKAHPRIKDWKNIEVIESFEVQAQSEEDAVIMYKRGKDGSYIN